VESNLDGDREANAMLKLGCCILLVFGLLLFGPLLFCILLAALDHNTGRRRWR